MVPSDMTADGRGEGLGSRLLCSFCTKPENEVGMLIAGDQVWICNECVMTCVEMINSSQQFEADPGN
jgi:ClpX C4-type zinc finger